jgi:hypothetical protein
MLPQYFSTRRGVASAFFVSLFALCAAPARAELQVTVSRRSAQRFESVGVTVKDPLGGLDVKPGPIALTVADGNDRRQELQLEPTGKAGEWSGRFTPLSSGRFTGTAVLDRGDEKEIGLLPLVRVYSSSRRGFIKLNPDSQRALKYSDGSRLFPVGVRLLPSVWNGEFKWEQELPELVRHGVNYVEIPVPWPGDPAADARITASIDSLLLWAERNQKPAVQLRLEGPATLDDAGISAYEQQLRAWSRRWGYSPLIAAWHLAGAKAVAPEEVRTRLIRAVREGDGYRHLVVVPSVEAGSLSGADLPVLQRNWQVPQHRRALIEVPIDALEPVPLPGESSWQMLAVGGVGLPLWPYDPADPDRPHFLQRLSMLSEAAGSIPFQTSPQPVTGVLPADHPAALTRYGSAFTAWLTTEGVNGTVNLPGLPRGRYRVRLWDPGQDRVLEERLAWSEGSGFEVELPQGVQAVFLRALPVSSTAYSSSRRYSSRRSYSRRRSHPKRVASRSTASRADSAKAKAAAKKKVKAQAAAKKKKAKVSAKKSSHARKASTKKKPAKKSTSKKKTQSKVTAKKPTKKPAPKKRSRRR